MPEAGEAIALTNSLRFCRYNLPHFDHWRPTFIGSQTPLALSAKDGVAFATEQTTRSYK